MRRFVLGLNAATVLLVLGGILLLVIPSPAPSGRVAPVVSFAAGTTDDARLPVADRGAAERVVRSNLFSSRRGPPARRSAFGEPAPDTEVAVDASTAALPSDPSPDSASVSTATDAIPHLYGTMLGPTESTALLRLDARVSEPKLFRVGERAGGYRVVDIGDRAVTLMGPNGRVVLRLARPAQ